MRQQQQLSIRIRSFHDKTIEIDNMLSIRKMKKAVITTLLGEQFQGCYVRLIYKGQLLAPDSHLVRDFLIDNGDTIHAVVAAVTFNGEQQKNTEKMNVSIKNRTNWKQQCDETIVSNLIQDFGDHRENTSRELESVDEEMGVIIQQQERQDYDRLRAINGLIHTDNVASIRSCLSRQVDNFSRSNPDNVAATDSSTKANSAVIRENSIDRNYQNISADNNNDIQQRNKSSVLRLEDYWILQQRLQISKFEIIPFWQLKPEFHFLLGLVLGYFVPSFKILLWLVVWALLPSIPQKQKWGILTGLTCKLAIMYLQGIAIGAEVPQQLHNDFDWMFR